MQTLWQIYVSLVFIPDYFYPFASKVGGKWVRGKRSYEHAVAHALRHYGYHRLGYKLTLYREAWHFLGSVLFIISAALISQLFFGNEVAFYLLLSSAIVALTFQEFYVHPKRYGQHLPKGIADWCAWVMPMVVYIFLFI